MIKTKGGERMEQWKIKRHWNTDDDLDMWLKQQGLANSATILEKLTLEGPVAFASGKRRLRYEGGRFYLEEQMPDQISDFGIGNRINTKALQECLQRLAGNVKVTVRLDKTMDIACSLKEYDKGNHSGFDVRLNPSRLRGAKQMEDKIAWLKQTIQG